MTSIRVVPVRQWLVLAIVLAAAVFLFWPRTTAACTQWGPGNAVDWAMPGTGLVQAPVSCQR